MNRTSVVFFWLVWFACLVGVVFGGVGLLFALLFFSVGTHPSLLSHRSCETLSGP